MGYGAGLPGYGAGRGVGYGAGAGGRYGAGTGSGYGAGVASSSTPLTIGSGLKLWIRGSGSIFQARAGTTACALDDDPVGYWTDESGIGNHAIAAADNTVRPSYRLTDGPASTKCVRADGVNDSLALSIALAKSHTLFATFKSAKTGYNPILAGEGGSGTYFMPRSSIPEFAYSASGTAVTFTVDVGTTLFKTLILRRSGTEVNLYVNGTLTDSPKTMGADTDFTMLTVLAYAGSIFGEGDLSEAGAYDNDIGATAAGLLATYLNRGVY